MSGVPVIIHCPACNTRHVDALDVATGIDWSQREHRTHLCHNCDHAWRPYEMATVGVAGAIVITYTNWRGETSERRIQPHQDGLVFGSNQWHTTPQWLLTATDLDKNEVRTFAVASIHTWRSAV